MFNEKQYNFITNYLYYIIIGFVSLVMLIFLPMLGSDVGVDFNLPTSFAGWCIFILTKLLVAVLNVMIFHCFVKQAQVNIKDNENYKKANDILNKSTNHKDFKPKSPKEYFMIQYGIKASTLFVATILSAFTLTQAILTFDYVSLLTYTLVLVFGIITGIIQMKNTEEYWINDYYKYALMVEKETNYVEDKI